VPWEVQEEDADGVLLFDHQMCSTHVLDAMA
jgi:benzoyl-CoA reductase/2-hydroxyglutaryl-CoA dehydratase subunit BcrC/BadD/HgdB